jgi:hypothetical protein
VPHNCVYVYTLIFATLSLCSCFRRLLDIPPDGIFSRSPAECARDCPCLSWDPVLDASDLFSASEPVLSYIYRSLPYQKDASPHCALAYSSGAFTTAARCSGRRVDPVSRIATLCLYARVLLPPSSARILVSLSKLRKATLSF